MRKINLIEESKLISVRAILALVLLYTVGNVVDAQDASAASKKADALFNQGSRLADEKKYNDAINLFRQSIKLKPSNRCSVK